MSIESQQIKCPKCGEVFGLDGAAYADIRDQVRGAELEREVRERLEQLERTAEAERERDVAEAKAVVEKKAADDIAKLKEELVSAKAALEKADADKELAVTKATQDAKTRQVELEAKIDQAKNEKNLALLKLESEFNEKLRDKDGVIQAVSNELAIERNRKALLSTKGVGEDFEQWCWDEFKRVQTMAFPGATFVKDNDARSGSKGDYIFRNEVDGVETLSIMFEMKNESSTTSTKKKNEDFFKELDKDRNEKGCEYAILVSTLEKESELYNQGIVDVSYAFPKMFVVRPWAFLQIIGLLRNASLNVIDSKREVMRLQDENHDFAEFMASVNAFKAGVAKNFKDFEANGEKAFKAIDESIKKLEATREALRLAFKHLNVANGKVEDLSIKSLTKGIPTIEAKFKALE